SSATRPSSEPSPNATWSPRSDGRRAPAPLRSWAPTRSSRRGRGTCSPSSRSGPCPGPGPSRWARPRPQPRSPREGPEHAPRRPAPLAPRRAPPTGDILGHRRGRRPSPRGGIVSAQSHATVAGLGSVLPDRVVPNEWFEAFIQTNDEWIRERTGIRERRFAADEQTTSDLAAVAATRALEAASIAPEQVDLLVCATLTGDTPIPSTAVWVQRKLGIAAPAFDVNAACAGFSYAMSTATA